MKVIPILEKEFYHDGRGPELQKVRWGQNGVVLKGFEYYNPDDTYEEENLKHLKLIGIQVFSMTTEEVHANILANGKTNAAIFEVKESKWLASFFPTHLSKCKHYQIMFYDEIYDIICEQVIAGTGTLNA